MERPLPREFPRREDGSSLLVVLLVMTVLSLTSAMFLMLGDTELKISEASLDRNQPLYVAEGVIELVRSWFDDPDPASNPLVPDPGEVELSQRRGDVDWDGIPDEVCDGSLDGRYRGGLVDGRRLLFAPPWDGGPEETFWGDRETPDVLIRRASPGDYLQEVDRLFAAGGPASRRGIRVAEIRIFAPVLIEDLAMRRGIATVEVTVEKWRDGRPVAERRVQGQLGTVPYPRTQGALETAGTLDAGGAFGMHWGAVLARRDLRLPPTHSKRFPRSSVPRKAFQEGRYEDFHASARDRTPDDGSPERKGPQNLLSELLGHSLEGLGFGRSEQWRGSAPLEDPWLRLAAGGDLYTGGELQEERQPWPYHWEPGDMPNLQRREDKSHIFARQAVGMTPFHYQLWKTVAASGDRRIHLLEYAGLGEGGEPVFRRDGGGVALTATEWTNSEVSGRKAGIFFFDTVDGIDPRDGGALTPAVSLSGADVPAGAGYRARGFLYFNAASVETSGIGSKAVKTLVSMPGEPFLDEGLDLDDSGTVGNIPEEIELQDNGRWDCDCDLDGDVDDDDLVAVFTAHDELAFGGVPDGREDPRMHRQDLLHQPHEPFLNLAYPSRKAGAAGAVATDYAAQGDLVEDRDDSGDPSPGDLLTTRGRDARGALVELALNVDGVLFNEGTFHARGGFQLHGSLVARAGVSVRGSGDLWFDERLLLGSWPPPELNLPRVVTIGLYDVPSR